MEQQAVVLIVDDTATNLGILAACLEENYQLKTAKNGAECLKIVAEEPIPDLILLDIEMPGMNGYEVCQHLKDDPHTASIPIIFVTGKITEEHEEKGFELGAVDYIVKPIRPNIVATRVRTHITIKQQHDKLEKMALYDQLTDLYNRHYLLDAAKQKVSAAIRHQYPLSVLILDIDHFKSVNDNYGHTTGDAVLKAVADNLKKRYRNEDIAARFGGEEFVVVLSHCSPSHARSNAESLRSTIEKLNPMGIKITISIGLAHLQNDEESFTDLLEKADKALYDAKDDGRNRVVCLQKA